MLNVDTHNLYSSIEQTSNFNFISQKWIIELRTRSYVRPKIDAVPVDFCRNRPQNGDGMYPSPAADVVTYLLNSLPLYVKRTIDISIILAITLCISIYVIWV